MTSRKRRKRGVSGRTRAANNREQTRLRRKSCVQGGVRILAHSSPLPSNLPDRWVTNNAGGSGRSSQPSPSPPPVTGCNSRNKKNLMTLQQTGNYLLRARFVGEFSPCVVEGLRRPPPISHPALPSLPLNAKKIERNDSSMLTMFRIEYYF